MKIFWILTNLTKNNYPPISHNRAFSEYFANTVFAPPDQSGEVSNGHVEGFPRFVKPFLTSVSPSIQQTTRCAEFFEILFSPFKNSQIFFSYISRKVFFLPRRCMIASCANSSFQLGLAISEPLWTASAVVFKQSPFKISQKCREKCVFCTARGR